MRVSLPHLGVVIAPPMVTSGERGDGVDMPFLEGLLPCLFIESAADLRDVWRGMEVEVDLSKSKSIHRLIRLLVQEVPNGSERNRD